MLNQKKLDTKILSRLQEPALFTIPKGSSKLSSTTAKACYDKSSRTVRIAFSFSASQNIATADILFTVPAGYRPSEQLTFPILVATDTGFVGGWGYVKANGEVTQGVTGYARNGFGFIEYKLGGVIRQLLSTLTTLFVRKGVAAC